MALDPSIALQAKLPQFDNPLNSLAQVSQIQAAQNQNALSQYTISKAQRDDADALDIKNRLIGAGGDLEAGKNALYQGGFYKQAQDIAKAQLEQREKESVIGKNNAETGKTEYETKMKKWKTAINDIAAFDSPESAMASLQAHVKAGDVPPERAQAIMQTMPQPGDTAGFRKWQLGMIQGIMDAKDRMEYIAPNANTVANNKTSLATNAATNATSLATNANTVAGSRANNADNIKSSQVINGIGADGVPAGDVEAMAKAISEGKLPPLSGFAIAKPRGQAIMARVMELNPTYDGGDYATKNAAVKAFSTGKEGAALRSFNVATDHLDTLSKMATALDNGDVQFINKAKNAWSEQFGGTAPTNFDAVKEIVGKEVVKAIVAGGGGVSEREELSNLLSKAKSHDQLQGVITHFKELMAAQKAGLYDQYKRTTGRDDAETLFAPSKKPAQPDTLVDAAGKTNAVSKAAIKSGDPANYAPKPGTVEGGYRFKGGNPTDARAWEKV